MDMDHGVSNHYIPDWHKQINLDCIRQSVSLLVRAFHPGFIHHLFLDGSLDWSQYRPDFWRSNG